MTQEVLENTGVPETLEDKVKVEVPTSEELEELEDGTERAERVIRSASAPTLDQVQAPTTVPEWALLPKDLKFPLPGAQVAFLRVKAEHCLDPKKGDRQCILWTLTEHDESQAFVRARGSEHRAQWELTKACIRAIDGHIADWSGENRPGSVSQFWHDIGPKGRLFVRNYYMQTHNASQAEIIDFFSNHFAFVTVLPA